MNNQSELLTLDDIKPYIQHLVSHSVNKVKKVEILNHMWLPLSRFYYKYFYPKSLYYILSRIWSVATLNRQMRIVVSK